MVAVGSLGQLVREGHLQFIHGLQQELFPFLLQVVKGRLLRDQVGVADDGTDEEAEVGHLLSIRDLLGGENITNNETDPCNTFYKVHKMRCPSWECPIYDEYYN